MTPFRKHWGMGIKDHIVFAWLCLSHTSQLDMNSLYGQASSSSNIFILLFVNNLVIGGAHLDFNLLFMFTVESRKLITTLFSRKLMCPEMVYVVIGVPISYTFQIHFHDLV